MVTNHHIQYDDDFSRNCNSALNCTRTREICRPQNVSGPTFGRLCHIFGCFSYGIHWTNARHFILASSSFLPIFFSFVCHSQLNLRVYFFSHKHFCTGQIPRIVSRTSLKVSLVWSSECVQGLSHFFSFRILILRSRECDLFLSFSGIFIYFIFAVNFHRAPPSAIISNITLSASHNNNQIFEEKKINRKKPSAHNLHTTQTKRSKSKENKLDNRITRSICINQNLCRVCLNRHQLASLFLPGSRERQGPVYRSHRAYSAAHIWPFSV